MSPIKFLRSKVVAVFILLSSFFIILVFLRHQIVSCAIEYSFKKETGFTAKMNGVYLSLLSNELIAQKIEILNPSSFDARRAILIEDFQCRYRLNGLLNGCVNIDKLYLKFSEINAVHSKEGAFNLEKLNDWIKTKLDNKKLQINYLTLLLFQAHYIDEAHKDREPLHFECKREKRNFSKIKSSREFDEMIKTLIVENSLNNLGSILKGGIQKIKDLF